MLKKRVITAGLLLLILLIIVFCSPLWALKGTVDLVVLLAAWEWSRVAYIENVFHRVLFVATFAVIVWIGFPMAFAAPLMQVALLWWCFAFCLVVLYQGRDRSQHTILKACPELCRGSERPSETTPNHGTRSVHTRGRTLVGFYGIFVLVPFNVSLKLLLDFPQGMAYLLWALCLVWATDTGAYFFGRAWGKHKLLPQVSPGKTVEGLMGGLLCAFVFAALWDVLGGKPVFQGVLWWLSVLALPCLSVVGDLFESMMKRQRGIKDSGTWLPGHGGILDRIDSLTPVFPVFLLLLRA